ncbi:MAG TPA: M12 family metallo-peptidase, partial [Casimicrobium huifangae]|nr:M12 family metallo-peptidase [Casimicrobium huifangae]
MYLNLRALFAGLGMGLIAAVASAANLWSDADPSRIATTGTRFIVPEVGRTMALNYAGMTALLQSAPLERDVAAPDSPFELELPLPEGGYGRFRVVESPIMEPGLAKRYPMLKTYLGQGIDNPTATVRFDLTVRGFRAQVIANTHTTYIEPYQTGDVGTYVVFNKSDYRKQGAAFTCGVTGEEIKSVPNLLRKNNVVNISSGGSLRTYRLALAATGEYTAVLGGTVLDGLSGQITTMNRVNGIYERELGVRMVLVANNDLIVYTNGTTDPYTNGNGNTMLGENQSNLNTVIGNANYDIGHVFSTGGGGVAGLGVVCNSGNKGRGVTGSTNPIADAYDVDYVAHEMGHQFAGNHTFNGGGGACNGNRSANSAYEPGSGVTIQAYAGICGTDNTQPNSEDYFHRRSLNEMLAFTTNAGTGASCGTLTTTGNNAPTVTTTAAFTIPQQTPFKLTASGTDPDGDTLTYLWEQFDVGAAANAEGVLVDAGSGPLFRSFIPTTDPTRIFPSLRYILNNANVVPATAPLPGTTTPNYMAAELLPSTNRTMNFRVTVRDNRAGGGGTNEASTAITVTTAAGPFAVTSPNTAVTWAAGSSQTITWNVAGTTAAPVSTANVEIALSVDGGYTFPYILAASTANDGTETLTIPAGIPATTQARIRVAAVGNVFFDISDTNFTITGANTAPTLTVTGSVTTRQGSPAATAVVATVSDAQDSAGNLAVSVSQVPPELTVTASNAGGNVSLTATASCSLVTPTSGNKTYPVLLTVTDSAGASTTLPVNVLVGANLIPTLGTYGNISMNLNATTTVTPSAAIADGNNNLVAASVSPTLLPGSGAGATLSIAANGTVTVNTDNNTTPGTYTVRAQANDSCGAVRVRQFTVTVVPTTPIINLVSSQIITGNGVIEPNECNQLDVTLTNGGGATAT